MSDKVRLSVFYDHILRASGQTGKDMKTLLYEAKDAGIAAVEIEGKYISEHDEVLPLLAETGLGVSCVYEFYRMDARDETAHIQKHIQTTLLAGASRVLVVPGFLSGKNAQDYQSVTQDPAKLAAFMDGCIAVQNMIAGMSCAVAEGEKNGVTVTIEDFDNPSSPISGRFGIEYFLKHAPGLKWTLDMGNFLYDDEDVLDAWELLSSYAAHVHCKDRGAKNESVAAGSGHIPIQKLLSALKESGYAGYLAIEHFDVPDQEGCMLQSAKYLKDTWAGC